MRNLAKAFLGHFSGSKLNDNAPDELKRLAKGVNKAVTPSNEHPDFITISMLGDVLKMISDSVEGEHLFFTCSADRKVKANYIASCEDRIDFFNEAADQMKLFDVLDNMSFETVSENAIRFEGSDILEITTKFLRGILCLKRKD